MMTISASRTAAAASRVVRSTGVQIASERIHTLEPVNLLTCMRRFSALWGFPLTRSSTTHLIDRYRLPMATRCPCLANQTAGLPTSSRLTVITK